MQLEIMLGGAETGMPHQFHQDQTVDVCIGHLTGKAVAQSVHIDVWQTKLLAP
jgi:hypothetical protein